jgi:amino acid adenylation domain-containing protein
MAMTFGKGVEDAYPLSSLQQGMLFHTLLNPESGVDIEQEHFSFHEPLDVVAFRQAWLQPVARHPILRTSFRWEDVEEPRQEVHSKVELPWEEHDWRGISVAERDSRFAELINADRRRGFDLARAPLWRLTMLRYSEAEWQLIWTVHHAMSDGRSRALIIQEVFTLYHAICRGEQISLPPSRPYRDYIDWLQQQNFSQSESFWRRTLRGFTAPTPLVVDHAPNERGPVTHQNSYEIQLSLKATAILRALALEHDFTLNTLVQGAWAVLLSRYSGEADVVFGVIRSIRRSTVEGAETMAGLLINVLPMRLRVRPEISPIPWLQEVRSQWEVMRDHEHTPLVNVQAWSEVLPGSPLFHSTVMFEHRPFEAVFQEMGTGCPRRRFRQIIQPNYPLNLAAYDTEELTLKLDFDDRRFEGVTIQRMLNHLRTLLESMAANPRQDLGELAVLTSTERNQLLVEWNRTAVEYPRNSCIHELFEQQVDRTPEAVAVIFGDQHLTYRELNSRSDQLAHHLCELGVGPNVLVGICAGRSLEMVIGLLGILKAGGAYVPIDPTYPTERVAFILHDANAPIVLTQAKLLQTLPASMAAEVVNLDEWDCAQPDLNSHNMLRSATDANLAYLMYTSGSTGSPKGAMIPHRAIANHTRWMQSTFPMDEHDCVLQKTEFSFDVSVWEIFAPLLVGARLVMALPGGQKDPEYLINTVNEHQVTVLQVVPSQLRMLMEMPEFHTCHSLRHVFCGGEPMTEDIPQRFYAASNAELHNMYGPTEAAIDTIYYSIPRGHCDKIIPIGRPVANTQAYVLDHHRQPVPIGVPGELYIGGAQVGLGYHGQPELTAQRFLSDPFSSVEGARLYRTGDMVRYLPDGNIQFLGRFDQQVKVRGFRIELGEVESTLQQHPGVRECAVVVSEDSANDSRLVAYVSPVDSSAPVGSGDLGIFLTQRLPAYMIPTSFILLERIPRLPNNKVDRNALAKPRGEPRRANHALVTARSPMQAALAGIWKDVLDLESVGVQDSFFELGGNSLLAVRLISKINRTLNLTVRVADLFKSPTIEQLTNLIVERGPSKTVRPAVLQIKAGKSDVPVYFIGASAQEFELARLMENCPVFGVDVPWPSAWRDAVAANRKSEFQQLEKLATPYVAALSAHIRSSRCVLAGFSFFGLIAFEVAHQLGRQGTKVEMVVLFDSAAKKPSRLLVKWRKLRELLRLSPNRLLGRMHEILKRKGKRIVSFADPDDVPEPSELTALRDEHGLFWEWVLAQPLMEAAMESYRLRCLDSRGILVRVEPVDVDDFDESLGWKNLFSEGLEIIPVNVRDHFSIAAECDLTLIRKLNEQLSYFGAPRPGHDRLQ